MRTHLRIEEANERIGTLKADIQKATADVQLLTKEIAELDEDISIWEGDIKAATNVREIEKTDYDATNKDCQLSYADRVRRRNQFCGLWAFHDF